MQYYQLVPVAIPTENADPVVYGEGDGVNQDGWYFFDEYWDTATGPYSTEAEARRMLKTYTEIFGHDVVY